MLADERELSRFLHHVPRHAQHHVLVVVLSETVPLTNPSPAVRDADDPDGAVRAGIEENLSAADDSFTRRSDSWLLMRWRLPKEKRGQRRTDRVEWLRRCLHSFGKYSVMNVPPRTRLGKVRQSFPAYTSGATGIFVVFRDIFHTVCLENTES